MEIVIAKMKNVLFLLVLLQMALNACSFTQKVKSGLQAYEVKQYAIAAELFQQEYGVAKAPEEKARLAYYAGESFARLRNLQKAAEWYRQAAADGYGAIATEKYAKVLIQQEKYTEAISTYEDLLKSSPGNAAYRAAITVCRQAKDWKEHPDTNCEVESADFNTNASEYSPQPIGPGKVLFTSDRDSKHTTESYLWTGRSFSDLYVWNKINKTSEEFDEKINTGQHEGTATLSPDGHLLVFTRCYVDQAYDGWCKLMWSIRRGNQWSAAAPFPFIQDKINYGQPAFAANGTTLFFSSDAPGGQGGHDLFYTQWNGNDSWTEPVNLGAGINTTGEELYPTVNKDTLYFSSDHLAGLGGLDIFKTYLDVKNNWVPPINLRAPINSGADDFGYVIDTFAMRDEAISARGYFTSTRGGSSRNEDVFSFAIHRPALVIDTTTQPIAKDSIGKPQVHHRIFLAATVKEPVYEVKDDPKSKQSGSRALPNGPIIITEGVEDRRLVTDELGQLLLELDPNKEYLFTARYRDHLAASFRLHTGEVERNPDKPITTINHVFILEPFVKNREIVLENIFYDYDQWAIREDAKPSLNHLSGILKANPAIRIQLSSYTDCRGTNEYNLELSQKRAQAAVEYLTSTGIAPKRLVAVGLGESNLTVQCECEKCTEEEHQANRRTTFKIID